MDLSVGGWVGGKEVDGADRWMSGVGVAALFTASIGSATNARTFGHHGARPPVRLHRALHQKLAVPQRPGHVEELVDDVLVPLRRRVLLHVVQVAGFVLCADVLRVTIGPFLKRKINHHSICFAPDPLRRFGGVEEDVQDCRDVVVHHRLAPQPQHARAWHLQVRRRHAPVRAPRLHPPPLLHPCPCCLLRLWWFCQGHLCRLRARHADAPAVVVGACVMGIFIHSVNNDPDSVLIALDSSLDAPSRSHELKIMQASVESARTRLALLTGIGVGVDVRSRFSRLVSGTGLRDTDVKINQEAASIHRKFGQGSRNGAT